MEKEAEPMTFSERYVLRNAAGTYFLLDTTQSGEPYRKPFVLNEQAASLSRLFSDGFDEENIAKIWADENGISVSEATRDIADFCAAIGFAATAATLNNGDDE